LSHVRSGTQDLSAMCTTESFTLDPLIVWQV
jgi:hypothetical protein